VTGAADTGSGDSEAYCPHCHLLVETDAKLPWPPAPVNCPHCRLLIAAGRARPEVPHQAGARGAAAGVFSSRAKRQAEGPEVGEEEIVAGIRRVAEIVGDRPERLLMIDYQQRCAASPDLPPLADVLATYGSWKSARRAAAEG
jgi:hypothetical protein